MARMLRYLSQSRALVLTSIGAAALLTANPGNAQNQQLGYSTDLAPQFEGRPPLNTGPQKTGSVATSSAGTAGQRQNEGVANIKTTTRLDARIANRVQSRIRNRIDPYYDPEANAISPFEVTADQARTNAITRPR